jgi:hypothetical protein
VITKALTKELGGDIFVNSEIGKGTTFEVYIKNETKETTKVVSLPILKHASSGPDKRRTTKRIPFNLLRKRTA